MAEEMPLSVGEPDDRLGSVRIDLPASLRYLNLPAAVLHALAERMPSGPVESTVAELELALQEACVNSVRHALASQPGARLSVHFSFEPGRVEIALEDAGSAFDADGISEPDFSEPQEGGYGLFLIEQLVDSVSYERADGINRWRLTKRWKDEQADAD